MLTLLYFASLRERLDCAREEVPLPPGTPTVGSVVEGLRARDGRWSEAFAGRRGKAAKAAATAHPATAGQTPTDVITATGAKTATTGVPSGEGAH